MLWMILALSGMFPVWSDALLRVCPVRFRGKLRSVEKMPSECRMPLSDVQLCSRSTFYLRLVGRKAGRWACSLIQGKAAGVARCGKAARR